MALIVNEYARIEVDPEPVYSFEVDLPRGAKVLSVTVRTSRNPPQKPEEPEEYKIADYVTVCAEVDTNEEDIYPRTFCVLESGYGIPEDDHFGWMFLCSEFKNMVTKHVYVRII